MRTHHTNPSNMFSLTNYKLFNPTIRRLAIIFFSLGVALGSGIKYSFRQPASDSKDQSQSAQAVLRRFGRAEYEQLRTGMSLTDVRSILYGGVEVSSSATMATFVWENPDGSKITATFEHDLLKNKEQSRLK